MALTTSVGNYFHFGTGAGLDGGAVTEWTCAAWVYYTNQNECFLFHKDKKKVYLGGWQNDGRIGASQSGISGACGAEGAANDLTTNKWWFVAVTFGPADGSPLLYKGDLATKVAGVNRGWTDDTRVGIGDDSGTDLFVGIKNDNSDPLLGNLAVFYFLDAQLALAALQRIQFGHSPVGANCQIYCQPGFHGTGAVPNLGIHANNATVVGTPALASHVPLGPPFGWDVYPEEKTLGFINIGDVWKSIRSIQINIGDVWKNVSESQINIGDVWKDV